ncbi:MAG: hypothetical protein IKW63_05280 [Elusimicrobiaceae bacterium]|nr:hypothetical protein [Elusimicrobiaceae bacterium]
MNGWAKFFLLIVCCIFTLILWPQYNTDSLQFMGLLALLWTCLILLVSIVGNIFALYKFEFLNRLVSLAYLAALLASLIYYFPLENDQTPYLRMKNNIWPTISDAKTGIERLTFNFDFIRRNANNEKNYINQQFDKADSTKKEIKKAVQKTQEMLDIIVEPAEEQESAR